MEANKIAQIAHAANRGYQTVVPNPTVPVSPEWDMLKGHERESIIIGVQGILDGNSPEESHQAWVVTKIEQGWVLGQFKDVAAMTHPNLVPYDELPDAEKVKDHLFSSIVLALKDA